MEQMSKRQVVIAHQNLHGAALLRKSPPLRAFFREAQFCYIDGMPLVWLASLCGFPAQRVHRNTQLDWLPSVLEEMSRRGMKLYFVGSPPATVERIKQYFAQEYSGLEFRAHHGFITEAEEEALATSIWDFDPDLIVVGMGMPRQEMWLQRNLTKVRFGAAIPSGAIFEYFVGAQVLPSRTTGRLGLEWLVRLWNEPRRLARRYLLEPWTLVIPALRDIYYYRVGGGRGERRATRSDYRAATTNT